MTEGLHTFMFEAGSLQTKVYSYCLCAITSMTNSFQSEVRFTHAADLLFFHFKFMFLTFGMSVRHDISNRVCTLSF